MRAPFVPVSSPLAVATMYTSASRTLSWKVTLRGGSKEAARVSHREKAG